MIGCVVKTLYLHTWLLDELSELFFILSLLLLCNARVNRLSGNSSPIVPKTYNYKSYILSSLLTTNEAVNSNYIILQVCLVCVTRQVMSKKQSTYYLMQEYKTKIRE